MSKAVALVDSLSDRDLKTLYIALLDTTFKDKNLSLQGLQVLTTSFLPSLQLPVSGVLGSLEVSLIKCLSLMTDANESLSLAASDFVNALCLYLSTRGLLHELIICLLDILD